MIPLCRPAGSLIANGMQRMAFLWAGWLALALGAIGAVLPVMPTVPFVILAAFCFARSSPELEARLLNHPIFGVHIRNWRERGAISRRGKYAATAAFLASIVFALCFSPFPWFLVPVAAGAIGGAFIWSRPDA